MIPSRNNIKYCINVLTFFVVDDIIAYFSNSFSDNITLLSDKLGVQVSPHPFAGAKWDMGPTSAGASLVDNKPRKLFIHKPNVLKSFEGSLRGTFQKVPLKKKLKLTDKSKI